MTGGWGSAVLTPPNLRCIGDHSTIGCGRGGVGDDSVKYKDPSPSFPRRPDLNGTRAETVCVAAGSVGVVPGQFVFVGRGGGGEEVQSAADIERITGIHVFF